MGKTVVIHQPDFASYLGFFDRCLHADLFIVLDHVQFVTGTSRSWMHRDKIKTANGEKWLTLSVEKAPRGTPINEIKLSGKVDWISDNLNLLKHNYCKAPFFPEIMPLIVSLYQDPPDNLVDFNLRSIELIMDLLDIKIPIVLSSALSPIGSKNELLVDLLKKVDAADYLSGVGARDYLETSVFTNANINVIWQQFNHPVYPQQFGAFIPYLSVLDALFNCGIKGTQQVLRSNI
jgi:hypothetical protein